MGITLLLILLQYFYVILQEKISVFFSYFHNVGHKMSGVVSYIVDKEKKEVDYELGTSD